MRRRWREPAAIAAEIDRNLFAPARCAAAAVAAGVRTGAPCRSEQGRAKLSTNPAATGSLMIGKTTGTVRVAGNSGPTVGAPWARMTSGESVANSAARRRISAASFVAQRVSMRTLRPIFQPSTASPCKTLRYEAQILHRPKMQEIAASRRAPNFFWRPVR
jgi:hypothetical protein